MDERKRPVVSVIVPSLTGEIPRSLREQVVGREDVELVVVAGVSPVGKARNKGLASATGEYVAWVDADDEVSDGWLKEILEAVGHSPDVVVIGHRWMVDGGFCIEKAWRGDDLLGDVLRQERIYGELWNKVMRRELWEGVRFDETARTMEDWEVLPQVLRRATSVVSIEKPLYRYYARQGSLTHQGDESMQREVFERAIGRLAEIRRLGLWRKHGRSTWGGVGYAVYCCAESLALSGNVQSPTLRDARRWIRRNLLRLMATPARLTYKTKWLLAAAGAWPFVRWYYAHRRTRS